MIRLTSTTRPTAGTCAECGAPATMWLRSTAHCGLVVAGHSCDAHESRVRHLLSATTVDDVAAQTRATPAALRRRADRLAGVAVDHARADASLRGASSVCHTHALQSAYADRQAEALRALADAIEARRS